MRRDLTRRQRLALDIYRRNGELNEGMMADEGWPVIRQPRLVVNGLRARGLVTLGDYIDEEVGYEILLTDAGWKALEA